MHISPAPQRGRLEFQFSVGRLLVATTLVAVAAALTPKLFEVPAGWYVAFVIVIIALFCDWSALHLQTADAAMKWGKYESAVAAYTKAIQGRPNDPVRFFRRGIAFYCLQDYKSAAHDFAAAVKCDSRFVTAWVWLGYMRQHLNEYQQSIDATTIALCIDPANTDALLLRADGYSHLGADENARADFSEVIRLSPRNSQAHFYRGVMEFQRHRYRIAVSDFALAIEFDPHSVNGWIWLANAYLMLGECQKSIAAATQAVGLEQVNVDALLTRGSVYSLNADYSNALGDLNEAIRLAPNDLRGFEVRGFCYLWSGILDKALVDFEHVIPLAEKGRARVGRAFTSFKLGNYPQAFQELESYVSANPNDEVGLRVLAWCLATCSVADFRNGERALQFGFHADAIDPECCWTSAGCVAAAHAELGNFDEAIRIGELAVARAAPSRCGDYERALQLYRMGKPFRDIPASSGQQ